MAGVWEARVEVKGGGSFKGLNLQARAGRAKEPTGLWGEDRQRAEESPVRRA